MTIDEMRNVRSLLQERIHVAMATKDTQLANDLLVRFNDVHWKIRDLEEPPYHALDVRHDLAMMETIG